MSGGASRQTEIAATTLHRYADYATRHKLTFNDGRGNKIEVGPSIMALLNEVSVAIVTRCSVCRMTLCADDSDCDEQNCTAQRDIDQARDWKRRALAAESRLAEARSDV
jgi:hypothetical protein